MPSSNEGYIVALLGFALLCVMIGVQARADTFSNDARTRTPMTEEQLNWIVEFKNGRGQTQGAGVLIANDLALTAHHVATSSVVGYTATKEHSFQVGALIEYSIDLDYAIVRIVWENETELKPQAVKVVTQFLAENTLTYGLDSSASSLVAYGFPIDRAFEPTAAAGFAKIYWGESGVFARSLLFNVGVTNGNSGGPVFLTDSFMMVSLVRSGVRQYGAEGHNGNDPEFAGAWNSGPAMFEICKVSNILKAKGCIPRY